MKVQSFYKLLPLCAATALAPFASASDSADDAGKPETQVDVIKSLLLSSIGGAESSCKDGGTMIFIGPDGKRIDLSKTDTKKKSKAKKSDKKNTSQKGVQIQGLDIDLEELGIEDAVLEAIQKVLGQMDLSDEDKKSSKVETKVTSKFFEIVPDEKNTDLRIDAELMKKIQTAFEESLGKDGAESVKIDPQVSSKIIVIGPDGKRIESGTDGHSGSGVEKTIEEQLKALLEEE